MAINISASPVEELRATLVLLGLEREGKKKKWKIHSLSATYTALYIAPIFPLIAYTTNIWMHHVRVLIRPYLTLISLVSFFMEKKRRERRRGFFLIPTLKAFFSLD